MDEIKKLRSENERLKVIIKSYRIVNAITEKNEKNENNAKFKIMSENEIQNTVKEIEIIKVSCDSDNIYNMNAELINFKDVGDNYLFLIIPTLKMYYSFIDHIIFNNMTFEDKLRVYQEATNKSLYLHLIESNNIVSSGFKLIINGTPLMENSVKSKEITIDEINKILPKDYKTFNFINGMDYLIKKYF